MKKIALLMALLGTFLLSACTQPDSPPNQDSFADSSINAHSAQPDMIGNLKLCDSLGSGGASTSEGYYYPVLRPDGNLNIRYLDYSSHTDIVLCNNPGCAHNDESCNSFVQSNGLIPGLAVINEKLLIVGGGINVSNPTQEDLPYIDTMELNGSNRKRVYQAKASSELGALLCDGKDFYTIEQTLENPTESPTLSQHLVKIDLTTGEKTVLLDMGENIIYPCGASGSTLYYYSIEPEDPAASLSKTITKYYSYDLSAQSSELLDTLSSDSAKAVTISDGTLYLVDSENQQLTTRPVTQASNSAPARNFPLSTTLSSCFLRCIVDGKLILDGQETLPDGTLQSTTYAIDLQTGSMQAWPLFYESSSSGRSMQVEISADLGDSFLVRCGEKTAEIDCPESGSCTTTIPQYALIKKSDFWAGNEAYTYFS